MRASIILPTYCSAPDVEPKLRRCLKLLAAHTNWTDKELIVVEQGELAAAKWLGTFQYQFNAAKVKIKYIHEAQPIGFAKAVNTGVEASSGDYLLIVNNDIDVSHNWADRLIKAYEHQPKAGLLFPACTDPKDAIETIEYPHSWWSCVCIARRVWDDVGKLDAEKLNYRMHDQDWSIRAFNKGYIVGCYRGVTVVHDDSSTYRHMTVNEVPERSEMIRRWGFEH